MAKSSKYKGVSIVETKCHGKYVIRYQAAMKLSNGFRWISHHENEIAAAKAYDIKLIEIGKKPVNILKPSL